MKYLFKMASTLTTASASKINLINSARFCRTFWQVGSSATLGTNSTFVGHILAMQSITATTGAVIQGQLLARNGAVTLDNNTIINGFCDISAVTPPVVVPPVVTTARIHVIKHVINDNGGKAVAANFKLHVKTLGKDISQSPAPGVESPGTTYTLAAGTYAISEDAFKGYTASYSGDSDASGNITLAPGDDKTITITNNDIAIPPIISNNGGGTIPIVTTPAVVEGNVVTTTITGGQLPKTSTHLYELLLLGTILTVCGAIGLKTRKSYE